MVFVWFHGNELDNVSMMPFASSLKNNQVGSMDQPTMSHLSVTENKTKNISNSQASGSHVSEGSAP